MRITFLGTGIMGAPMAGHLVAAGHDVTVWNRTSEKAQALVGDGAHVARDPAAAAAGAAAIVTMLTDGHTVEDVMAEAAPAAPDGALWWQASTVGIAGTEGLAALAEEHGLTLVDAPVLGTKGPAESGELVVLASGPAGRVPAQARAQGRRPDPRDGRPPRPRPRAGRDGPRPLRRRRAGRPRRRGHGDGRRGGPRYVRAVIIRL